MVDDRQKTKGSDERAKQIRVLYSSPMGKGETLEIEIDDGGTVGDVLKGQNITDLAGIRKTHRIVIDGKDVDDNVVLKPGDRIAVVPKNIAGAKRAESR